MNLDLTPFSEINRLRGQRNLAYVFAAAALITGAFLYFKGRQDKRNRK